MQKFQAGVKTHSKTKPSTSSLATAQVDIGAIGARVASRNGNVT